MNYIDEKCICLARKHKIFKSIESIDQQRAYNIRVITWKITGGLRIKIVFRQFSIYHDRVSYTHGDYSTAVIPQLFSCYLEAKGMNDE